MKKWIPLWLKCGISVFIHQIGRLPLKIVLRNVQWVITQSRNCSAEKKDKVYQKVQQTVCRYLSKKYADRIENVLSQASQGIREENAPIWVFWWQGVENAPYLVQTCIESIKKNAGSHPVNVVDAENYLHYVQVPGHIRKKLQDRKISITHFSDYLRMALLAEHGGMWVDATVFVQKTMAEEIFRWPIWTVRNPGDDTVNISGWKWAINFIGGWKGNVLFRAAAEVLDCYWQEHDMVADYFMTDCLVRVIYDKCAMVRELIDAIPSSNSNFYYFLENFNLPLDRQSYVNELNSETWAYKISWKGNYECKLSDGRDTLYGKWKTDFGA